MKSIYFLLILIAFSFFSCGRSTKTVWNDYNPLDYVDQLSQLQSVNGARPTLAVPKGSIQIQSLVAAADSAEKAESGQNEMMYGFSHTLVSHENENTQGNILLSPSFGEFDDAQMSKKSAYSLEVVSPGYYKTMLDKFGAFAEMTLTPHTALHQYHFRDGWAHITIDLSNSESGLGGGMLRFNGPMEIFGFTYQKNNIDGERSRIWFVIRFDRTAMNGGLFKNGRRLSEKASFVEGENISAFFSYRTLEGGAINAKIALSPNSVEEAIEFLNIEQPAWSFPILRKRAQEEWQNHLSAIMVHGGTDEHKSLFYRSLYRTLLSSPMNRDDSTSTINNAAAILLHLKTSMCADTKNNSLLSLTAEQANSGDAARMVKTVLKNNVRHSPAAAVSGMLGLLPACDQDQFLVLPPLFECIKFRMAEDQYFCVEKPHVKIDSDRIKKIILNDKELPSGYLLTEQIVPGGVLQVHTAK